MKSNTVFFTVTRLINLFFLGGVGTFWSVCRNFENCFPTRLNRSITVHETGKRAEIHKKIYNSQTDRREIQFRRRWGSFASYMPNSVILTVQLRGVSRSFWLLRKLILKNSCLAKSLNYLGQNLHDKQTFIVSNYNIKKIITISRIITSDNTTDLSSHIETIPKKNFQ